MRLKSPDFPVLNRGPLLVSQLRSELGRAAVDVPILGVVYHSEKDNDYSITIIVTIIVIILL